MATLLKYFLVTCLLMFFVEPKPSLGRQVKRNYLEEQEIEIDPSVTDLVKDIKWQHTHKYAAFKVINKRKIVIDETILGEPIHTKTVAEDEKQFNKMKSLLTNKEPRLIIYDFGFTSKEGKLIKKATLILWSSDTASIKASILYHSIFQTMKEAFDGLAGRFQAYSPDDLDYTKYKERVEKEA